MNNSRSPNNDYFPPIFFRFMYIFSYSLCDMLGRPFTRTATSHKLKNIHSLSWSFRRNYFNSCFANDNFISFFYIPYGNTLSTSRVYNYTFIHHHISYVHPSFFMENLSLIVCSTIEVIRHYHIFRSFF